MTGISKTKRTLLIFLAVFAVTAVATSCYGRTGKEYLAQKLLQGKCREQFSVSADKVQELGTGYYSGKAYSMQYPDMPFSVSIDNDGKKFSDNYVARRVCSKIEERIRSNIHPTKGKVLVHVEAMVQGHALDDPDMTVSDFVDTNPSNRFSIYIFSASDKLLAGKLEVLLSGLESLPGGTIYIYNTSESAIAEMQKYCKETDTPVSEHIELKDDCVYTEIPFAHGKILGRCQ